MNNLRSDWECPASYVSLCLFLSCLYPSSSNFSPSLWCGPQPQPANSSFTFTSLFPFLNIPPHLRAEPYFLSPLAFSFLLWPPTCLTHSSFFLQPYTPVPATQYFQFTLLLSNLPLHSSHAPLHYLALSPSSFCPPLAVGLSEGWIQGSSFSLNSITHTPTPHVLIVKCVFGLFTLIFSYRYFSTALWFCMTKPLCAFGRVYWVLLYR